MANKVPLDLSEDEIQQRCDEIQETCTDAVREQRRRGTMADGTNRDSSPGPIYADLADICREKILRNL